MKKELEKTNTPAGDAKDGMNLTKRLAVCGIASRRKAAELIKTGHVTVNGETQSNPATIVTMRDRVAVDGASADQEQEHVYIMLNKPRGYVCTNEDPHAKKRALELIRLHKDIRLFSIGRLDKDSEGLILFTSDGDFAKIVGHPSSGIRKTYALSAEHPFSSEELQQMCDGVENDGEELHAEDIYQSGPRKYLIVLQEGKNREIRRMTETLGNTVKRLERVAIGNLKRGMLKCGEWRFMSKRDIALVLGMDIDDPGMAKYPDDLLKHELRLGRPNFAFAAAMHKLKERKNTKLEKARR